MGSDETIAKFSPWLKYYDRVYQVVNAMQVSIMMAEYEQAIDYATIAYDMLDVKYRTQTQKISAEFEKTHNKTEKLIKRNNTNIYLSNNDGANDKIKKNCLHLHRLLQRAMDLRGMKVDEKTKMSDEYNEEEFLKMSGL